MTTKQPETFEDFEKLAIESAKRDKSNFSSTTKRISMSAQAGFNYGMTSELFKNGGIAVTDIAHAGVQGALALLKIAAANIESQEMRVAMYATMAGCLADAINEQLAGTATPPEVMRDVGLEGTGRA